MKIVINVCYGGFKAPDHIIKKYNYTEIDRTDEDLIKWVEENTDDEGIAKTCSYSELMVVEIPDEATDYYISEYDGLEEVVCVIDGKLHWIEIDF